MPSFKEIRRKTVLKFLLFYAIISIHSQSSLQVSAEPNRPRLFGIIPPPQVLLPPHREEGQSLDDIIYGTSFSGGSLFPSSLTSLPPIPTTARPSHNNFHQSFQQPNRNGGRSNANLVQTFLPPSPPPPTSTTTSTTTTTTTTSRPFIPANSIFATSSRTSPFSSTSAEEIKVPQTLKLRSPQRKQYTKADLIAAANSLRPAGFDFNKLPVVTPTRFNSSSGDKASHIYQNARFPLPLFDTPVFNEIRPLMEMILKQRQLQQQQQQSKFGARNSESDNKKVLVIIPKQLSRSTDSARSVNRGVSQSSNRASTGNRKAKQLSFPTPTTTPASSSIQVKSPSSSNYVVVPKNPKFVTTSKPKPIHASTTKRISKLAEVPKKSEKSPDLQVAATSNKLSQQKTSGKTPSALSNSDKRSYSLKGADEYSFSYEVKNDAFGDVKSHSESRNGDLVEGTYSMLEADGYTRIVRYTVDSDQGFKASVKRIPPK